MKTKHTPLRQSVFKFCLVAVQSCKLILKPEPGPSPTISEAWFRSKIRFTECVKIYTSGRNQKT